MIGNADLIIRKCHSVPLKLPADEILGRMKRDSDLKKRKLIHRHAIKKLNRR